MDNGLEISLDRNYEAGETSIDYHSNWVNQTDPNNLAGNNGKRICLKTLSY